MFFNFNCHWILNALKKWKEKKSCEKHDYMFGWFIIAICYLYEVLLIEVLPI